MFRLIEKSFTAIKKKPIYFSVLTFLLILIVMTQNQYWFGDHSHGRLIELQDNISSVELERDKLKENNQILVQEKMKLSSGKQALEGTARIELGMIRPDEKFYVFKEEKEED